MSRSTPDTRKQLRDAIARDLASSHVPKIRLKWGRIALLATLMFTMIEVFWIIGMVLDQLPYAP